jgi:hypothetical protein
LIIPNKLYTQQLSRDIEKAGLRSFSGELNGRVAWIIPLNQHRTAGNPYPARKYRFGRAWTKEEDKLLLEVLEQSLSYREAGRRLAERLNRTPRAIETRLRKLAKKGLAKEAATPTHAKPPNLLMPKEGHVTPALDTQALTSMLEASLLLAEDPRWLPAIRVLLSRAVQLLSLRAEEAANKNS